MTREQHALNALDWAIKHGLVTLYADDAVVLREIIERLQERVSDLEAARTALPARCA